MGNPPGTETVPISVVIPTVGRPRLVAQALESLVRCDPRAAEVLVVDQSPDDSVAEVVTRFAHIGARRVPLAESNLPLARNVGLKEVREDVVLFIDDDCTVDEAWARTAWRLMDDDPDRIVTGRVLGTSPDVPSVRHDEERHDHTGEPRYEVLRPNNMGVGRRALLEFDGFDERLAIAGEDLDLCYRWLRAGRRLWFEPELVVWHHDWRTEAELSQLYRRYWYGRATFYGKHLSRGDAGVLPFVARDLKLGMRAVAGAVVRRESLGMPFARLRLLFAGIARGIREWRARP
jgi:GT2 family glycosyltransferase